MKLNHVMRKARYAVWIPRKITRKPKEKGAAISDLFPLRSDSQWKTHFELLNVPGLIYGNNALTSQRNARFLFFNNEGVKIGEKLISIPATGRETIELDFDFHPSTSRAASFSVFHEGFYEDLEIGQSYVAERGYTGYSWTQSEIRGYVHGNHDSVAYKDDKIQTIGNKGLLSRLYTVQHPLRGPAIYEFFVSNPSRRPLTVHVLHGQIGDDWVEIESFRLSSRGSRIFRIQKSDSRASFVRLKSRLYLGRPVVFRLAGSSFDVFHG
jgi:hypothetical protein